MAGSVTDFTGKFGGGLRPNRFKIISSKGGADMEFYAKASSLPPSTIGKCEVPYMGRIINVAGDRTFDDWNVTVYNDLQHPIRSAILNWMSLINGHISNTGPDAPSDYYDKQGTYVQQLDRAGNQAGRATMYDLFPISCGEVSLGWDSNDQVEEFEVTFAINYWIGDGMGGY